MKYFYTTPEIKIEELMKQDVLCASDGGSSSPSTPSGGESDTYTLIDEVWNTLEDILP